MDKKHIDYLFEFDSPQFIEKVSPEIAETYGYDTY